MSRPVRIIVLLSLPIAVALLIFAGYQSFQSRGGFGFTFGAPKEFDAVEEAWQILSREFVDRDRLTPETLSEGAIRGMLDVLEDPYSSYLAPKRYTIEKSDQEGHFSGVGAEVTMRNGRLTVVAPIAGTPAERMGIRPGDVILEVDGESLEGKNLLESVLLIRGPRGSTVSLLVLHHGDMEPILIDIVRDVIEMSSVMWRMVEEEVAYLRISSFVEGTLQELKEALKEIQGENAQGLILDVRNNPGGLLTTTVEMTSQFLTPEQGLVLYEIDGTGQRTDWKILPGGLATEIPLVVLVNHFSASASEVLTGALQAHHRAVIVGETTFGKGSVNTLRKLRDGSGIAFTIARWYTPDNQLIEGEGLTPDIVVEQPADAQEDLHLRKAIEVLRSGMRASVTA